MNATVNLESLTFKPGRSFLKSKHLGQVNRMKRVFTINNKNNINIKLNPIHDSCQTDNVTNQLN